MHFTRFGWPEHCRSLKENCREFFASRSELSISDGLLLYRDRIAIPKVLRPEIMEKIPEGHQRINKCRARANMCLAWPDIRLKITTCEFCQIHKPAQKREPFKSTPLPSRPWQKVAADLCELDGKQYLVVTDYFSRYLEICRQLLATKLLANLRISLGAEVFPKNSCRITRNSLYPNHSEHSRKRIT